MRICRILAARGGLGSECRPCGQLLRECLCRSDIRELPQQRESWTGDLEFGVLHHRKHRVVLEPAIRPALLVRVPPGVIDLNGIRRYGLRLDEPARRDPGDHVAVSPGRELLAGLHENLVGQEVEAESCCPQTGHGDVGGQPFRRSVRSEWRECPCARCRRFSVGVAVSVLRRWPGRGRCAAGQSRLLHGDVHVPVYNRPDSSSPARRRC